MVEDNFWPGRRVLVTGGTGFLGKHMVDALIKKGALVRISDFRKPAWDLAGASFIEADIRDKEKLISLSEGIDTIFHLAAMPSIAKGRFEDYYAVNVIGTRNALEAAFKNGVRKLAYVSSSTVYGIPAEFPLRETSPLRPLGKYSGTKLEAENVCRDFIAKGLNVSIIRPRVIMGPGRIGIFSILFDSIYTGKPVYILGNGKNIFQFTNVFDMVDACLKAAEYDTPELFNIGSDLVSPVREELTSLIKHANSRSRIISIPAGFARFGLKILNTLSISPLVDEQFNIADKDFKLDTTKAKHLLSWEPKYSNLESLIQAYDWYVVNLNANAGQYKNILGILGKFRHSKMGGFQNG